MACYGVVCYGVVWYGVVWYGIIWCGIIWYDVVWYGMKWYSVIYDMIWYDMIWYDMIWYDVIWYMIWYCLPHSQRCDSRFLWNNTLAWCMSYDIAGLVVGCVFSSTMCWRCHGLWRSQRYDMIYDMIWYYNMVWCDMVWYDIRFTTEQATWHVIPCDMALCGMMRCVMPYNMIYDTIYMI